MFFGRIQEFLGSSFCHSPQSVPLAGAVDFRRIGTPFERCFDSLSEIFHEAMEPRISASWQETLVLLEETNEKQRCFVKNNRLTQL